MHQVWQGPGDECTYKATSTICVQVADTLRFLHQDCNLVHRALCPDAVMLVGGAFKLAFMGFLVMAEFSTQSTGGHAFQYDTADTELQRLLKPPLQLTGRGRTTMTKLFNSTKTSSRATMFGCEALLAYWICPYT